MPTTRDGDDLAACQFQRIGPQTLPAALSLLRQLANSESAALPRAFQNADPRHANLAHYLTHPPASHWHLGLCCRDLADSAPQVLGLVSGFMIPDPQSDGEHPAKTAFFLNSLVIAAAHRGKGLGRHCIDGLALLARARGAERIYLALSHFNTSAQPFYQRQGFRAAPLLYWGLGHARLNQTYQQLEQDPLMLHRCVQGNQPGLVCLYPPGKAALATPAPAIDLAIGFDFGLAAWEAWLSPPAVSHATAWDGQVYALALRQLQNWYAKHHLSDMPDPRFGLTGLAPRLPEGAEIADAQVWQLDLVG